MQDHKNSHGDHEHFVVPLKYYVMTFVVLIFMTILTVVTAKFFDLGLMDLPFALFLASIKAMFVVLFFMGVRWEEKFNTITLFSSFIFVFIFLLLTLGDILTRGSVNAGEDKIHDVKSLVKPIDKSSQGKDSH